MIFAQAGTSFEATSIGWATGLAGTLGVRVVDNTGGTPIARVTAGIVEFPAGSGRYQVVLTAPALAGQYDVLWDNGSGVWAGEELLVTLGPPATPVPGAVQASPRALCTIADVKAFLNLTPEAQPADQAVVDDLLQNMVNGVSDAIHQEADREFVQSAAGVVREFEFPGPGHIFTRELPLYGDLSAFTLVRLMDVDTGALAQDVTAFVQGRPRVRKPWEPIRRLFFRSGASISSASYVEVTGTWGFPQIPYDIKEWAIIAAGEWYARDVEKFSGTFNTETQFVVRPRKLPDAVLEGVDSYRMPGL